jgi:hypothetical protein
MRPADCDFSPILKDPHSIADLRYIIYKFKICVVY